MTNKIKIAEIRFFHRADALSHARGYQAAISKLRRAAQIVADLARLEAIE